MKYKVYKHLHTKEQVYEEDWGYYAMEQLGIEVKPKGKHGELTQEQIEFIEEFTDWYFSGNWILEQVKDNEENDEQNIFALIDEECELYDRWEAEHC